MKTNMIAKAGSKVKDLAGITGLKLKANSPDILLGIGITAITAGVVVACKATLKAEEPVNQLENTVAELNDAKTAEGGISEDTYRKELVKAYVGTAKNVGKMYAPAFLLVGGGIGCIVGGQRILKKRNIALAAAYKMVDDGYSKYRENVVAELGEDADRRFRYGASTVDQIEYETQTEDGKTKKKKVKNAEVVDGGLEGYSPYAKFFDEGCDNWVPDAEYNLMFLRNVQKECQRKFDRRGYLMLSEVYDALGIPVTEASLVVGWLKGYGDDDISFDIYNTHREPNRDFVNGYEPVILLDFNVAGTIYDKLHTLGLGKK